MSVLRKSTSVATLGLNCALLSIALNACAQGAVHAESVVEYRQRQERATPASVLASLRAGNFHFAEGKAQHGGYQVDARERMRNSALGQRPLAVVLSCIDSRTSPELVFDVAVGDLFTARVGANVVNDDILGSLEIAVDSGAKVIVVLGHTDCGGVKGACAGLELGHMTQLLERVKPAIASANAELDANSALSAAIGERVVGNRRYIAHVSHANAVQSARQIRERSPFLREKIASGEVVLIAAVYDVDTGLVRFEGL
jgi:carbonic anhydrase